MLWIIWIYWAWIINFFSSHFNIFHYGACRNSPPSPMTHIHTHTCTHTHTGVKIFLSYFLFPLTVLCSVRGNLKLLLLFGTYDRLVSSLEISHVISYTSSQLFFLMILTHIVWLALPFIVVKRFKSKSGKKKIFRFFTGKL